MSSGKENRKMEAEEDLAASNRRMQYENICGAAAAIIGAETPPPDSELFALLDKIDEIQQECVEVIEACMGTMMNTIQQLRELSKF